MFLLPWGLTAGEAAAVKSLMTDLSLSNGTTVYSGFGIGNMAQWGPAYAGSASATCETSS